MKRHQMRQNALLLIFERMFNQYSVSEILEIAEEVDEVTVNQQVSDLFKGVSEHTQEMDNLIEKHLNKWKIDRISKISLAILRLAVYEIVYSDVETPIVINEAVELAKEYSNEEDAGFVNGVLGSFAKAMDTP